MDTGSIDAAEKLLKQSKSLMNEASDLHKQMAGATDEKQQELLQKIKIYADQVKHLNRLARELVE